MKIPFIQLPHGVGLDLPRHETEHAAGLDLRAAITENITLQPGERHLIGTGLQMALPVGYEAQIRPRSGLAYKHGLTVLNTPGTIDADYRGEIKILLINLGQEPFTIERGMRIAQMIIAPYQKVDCVLEKELDETQRASSGFASTGLQ